MVDLNATIGSLIVILDETGTISEDGGQCGRVGYVCSIAIGSDDDLLLRSWLDFHVDS